MQHLSPHLVLSLRHWPKHPGHRSTARCCQHWEGCFPLTWKAFGVFSCGSAQKHRDAQSYAANGPTSPQALPASLLRILFFKRATTALRCKSTTRAHPPLSSLSPSSFQLCCSLHFTAITDRGVFSVGSCISTGSRNQRGSSHFASVWKPPPRIFVVGLSSPPPPQPPAHTHNFVRGPYRSSCTYNACLLVIKGNLVDLEKGKSYQAASPF